MNLLKVFDFEGQNVTDSRLVAEMIGVQHKNLLQKIKGYEDILTSSKFSSLNFFISSTYKDTKGEERPCYLLTKQGCEMVANKLTGEKGVLFTATYVEAFNQMEQQNLNFPTDELGILKLAIKAIDKTDKKIQALDSKVEQRFDEMPLFGVDQDTLRYEINKKAIVCLGGKESNAYHDNSLRGKVYSDIHGQIRREFGVETYKAIQRKNVEMAKSIIQDYKLPIALSETIQHVNSQENLNI